MAYFHTTVLDNQIKALPTVDTASGSVATFDTDITENLVEVKCQIVAQQSGSGTPSPSNPRPITTYTKMDVVATGKNLLAKPFLYFNSVPITLSEYFPIKAGNYVISFNSVTGATSWRFNIRMKDRNGNNLSGNEYQPSNQLAWNGTVEGWINGVNVTFTSLAFTIVEDCFVRFTFSTGDTSASTVFSDVILNRGDTALPYEPFGSTANIPFGQTVANGVLDITTGKLYVDGVQNLGAIYYTYNSTNNFFVSTDMTNRVKKPATNDDTVPCLCEIYSATSRNALNDTTLLDKVAFTQSGNLVIRDTRFTDATQFRNALLNDNVLLYYPMATPTEIQLDSITLQALLNENNIWCDTGDTEVKYLLTVGKKIA